MHNPRKPIVWQRCLLFLTVLHLASCSYTSRVTMATMTDGAGAPVDANHIADAVPKVEPITKAGNKSPYQVFGKTYFVLPSSKDYRQSGIASWYGRKFHGKKTSNGETYNMYAMTAAHKSLPIPTYVRVTNLDNKRSVIVRINDRGPFHEQRLIDLSYVAALKLGYADKGTTDVLIEAIDPSVQHSTQPQSVTHSTAQTAEDSTMSSPEIKQGSYLQLGAFDDIKAAKILQKNAKNFTTLPILVQREDNLFKVWLGPATDDIELLFIRQKLKQAANISSFLVSP